MTELIEEKDSDFLMDYWRSRRMTHVKLGDGYFPIDSVDIRIVTILEGEFIVYSFLINPYHLVTMYHHLDTQMIAGLNGVSEMKFAHGEIGLEPIERRHSHFVSSIPKSRGYSVFQENRCLMSGKWEKENKAVEYSTPIGADWSGSGNAREEVQKAIEIAKKNTGLNVPNVIILFEQSAFDFVKISIAGKCENVDGLETIYGIPFEVHPSQTDCHRRAVEIVGDYDLVNLCVMGEEKPSLINFKELMQRFAADGGEKQIENSTD